MADEVRDWVFPARCPNCLVDDGLPVDVASKTQLRLEIFVRCGCCAHEWRLSADTPALFVSDLAQRRPSSGERDGFLK
jgi:hypothetical protein